MAGYLALARNPHRLMRTALIARCPVKHTTVRARIGLSGMAEPHRKGTCDRKASLARVVNCETCGTDRTKIPLFREP